MSEIVEFERPRTYVRERAEEQTQSFSEEQQRLVRNMANTLHRLNEAVMKAVEGGLSVELIRSSRHHSESTWGDLLVPVVFVSK